MNEKIYCGVFGHTYTDRQSFKYPTQHPAGSVWAVNAFIYGRGNYLSDLNDALPRPDTNIKWGNSGTFYPQLINNTLRPVFESIKKGDVKLMVTFAMVNDSEPNTNAASIGKAEIGCKLVSIASQITPVGEGVGMCMTGRSGAPNIGQEFFENYKGLSLEQKTPMTLYYEKNSKPPIIRAANILAGGVAGYLNEQYLWNASEIPAHWEEAQKGRVESLKVLVEGINAATMQNFDPAKPIEFVDTCSEKQYEDQDISYWDDVFPITVVEIAP